MDGGEGRGEGGRRGGEGRRRMEGMAEPTADEDGGAAMVEEEGRGDGRCR